MKVAIFTSNQPRHLSLIDRISAIVDELYVIQESKPLITFSDSNNKKYFQKYMQLMVAAEKEVFGDFGFSAKRNRCLTLRLGEASKLSFSSFKEIYDCDFFFVFGCGLLTGELGDFLIQKKAINLHMGLSPFFKGSACNFWAQYLGRSEFIGATIHYLSSQIDGGAIIERTIPKSAHRNGFIYSMQAVLSGQKAIERILSCPPSSAKTTEQDPTQLIHYSRKAEFTEDVIKKFLENELWDNTELETRLKHNKLLNQIPLTKI